MKMILFTEKLGQGLDKPKGEVSFITILMLYTL